MLKRGDGVSDCLLSAGLNIPGERCITTAGFLLYKRGAPPPTPLEAKATLLPCNALRWRYIRGLATGSGDDVRFTVMVTELLL